MCMLRENYCLSKLLGVNRIMYQSNANIKINVYTNDGTVIAVGSFYVLIEAV